MSKRQPAAASQESTVATVCPKGLATRTFEFTEGDSAKFWEGWTTGAEFTTRWGRLGTNGQTKTKACESPAAAQAALQKLIAEKVGKGYRETTTAAAPSSPASSSPLPAEPELATTNAPAANAPPSAPAAGISKWMEELNRAVEAKHDRELAKAHGVVSTTLSPTTDDELAERAGCPCQTVCHGRVGRAVAGSALIRRVTLSHEKRPPSPLAEPAL